MPAKIDLTNQRFSYLTVVKEKERQSKKERLLWECQCDCGNVTYVSGTDLRSGHTKSCGCAKSQPINMLGFKTGKLTVISQAKSDNGAKWNCQCECGKIIQVFGSTLRGKKAPQSCGCERVRKTGPE